MEEEDEEKRSDTPERKDKDDLEKKDTCTKLKELDPEEKEEDTTEVKGAHAGVMLELENVDSQEEKEASTKSKDGEEVQKVNGESSEAGSDVSLLSPKRHLERQVKSSFCHLKMYSSL